MSNVQKRRFMLLPHDHTVMVRQTSKWGQIFLLSLVGLGATAFTTAYFYKIDEVITVKGRLVPELGGVEVKSPIPGQLSEVLVNNGQTVEIDDKLIQFDVEEAKSLKKILKNQINLELKRQEDQLIGNNTRQETLQRNVELTERILRRLEPLKESGAISELQLLQQENQLETQKDELTQIENSRNSIINNSNTRLGELQGELLKQESLLKNEYLKAPIKGKVFELKPDSNKYIATNAETLLTIVPLGDLSGEVNVNNRDIGFIQTGQPVKVRVDSFPFTEYGEIDGKISSIGADALPPTQIIPQYHFPVTLKLDRSELRTEEDVKIPLQAGMTITTNVKLRDRRLISLLSDLFTSRSESLQRLRQP